ncbi:hypothetical protein FJ980_26160 [Mesorhizobium sp. B1-1-5]|nr:hypothetical protein FJ980_26160 [Mesorhizobium sp. B1-1-5]
MPCGCSCERRRSPSSGPSGHLLPEGRRRWRRRRQSPLPIGERSAERSRGWVRAVPGSPTERWCPQASSHPSQASLHLPAS